jgi:hypothetical protein
MAKAARKYTVIPLRVNEPSKEFPASHVLSRKVVPSDSEGVVVRTWQRWGKAPVDIRLPRSGKYTLPPDTVRVQFIGTLEDIQVYVYP